ncbi:MAG: DUF420 domain-containing protein [Planctomycetales bacterium]|nr:DUF420 domain-containing protein [Planctomycetales bacterium]
MPEHIVHLLPHVNAALNSLATVLLVTGYVLIKRGRETAHRNVMLSCFGVSAVFLVSYLIYHYSAGHVKFPTYPPQVVRTFYFAVLLTHILLAVAVPFLAVATIYFGLKERRSTHRRWAKWTYPIWLYVSVTGVIVYLMLYQLYPVE